MNLTQQPFGAVRPSAPADIFTLTNDHGVTTTITNYGGIIATLQTPDRHGQPGDIVLGFDSLAEYVDHNPFFGCLAGRFANRIAAGKFTLKGKDYALFTNASGNHLHGGKVGFDKRVWAAEPFSTPNAVGVQLSYHSEDGEEGYPGNLDVTVTYTLDNDNGLTLDYRAKTDQATVLNLTNHTYFNLAGQGDILGHTMMLNADTFTPVNQRLIPTGELRSVAGTPFDFRTPHRIGDRIEQDDEQLKFGGGYDVNWVVNGDGLRLAARVTEETSGRVLEAYTTQPGIQFYSGNMMPLTLTGKGGQVYHKRYGLCLETQHFPDSPNQPNFPSAVLEPGDTFHEVTVFKFSAE